MTGRFMWVMAVSAMCQSPNRLLFTLKWGTTKLSTPQGFFPLHLAMRVAGQDTKRNCREERLKKMEALMYSYSLTPFLLFLCINSFNNLAKANPETRRPFPNQCHKTPCHLMRNIMMRLNGVISSSIFFSFSFDTT